MDLLPSSEELSIAETVAELLEHELPISLLHRPNAEFSVDSEKWSAIAESGLLGLGLDEESGGAGFTVIEEALAFREIGRHLASGPFAWSLLAARLAAGVGDSDLVEQIIGGERQVGLVQLRAGAEIVDGAISGPVDLIDAKDADLVLLLTEAASGLYERASLGEVSAVETIDPGTGLETATPSGAVPVHFVGSDPELYARGLVLLAAIFTGISEACRDSSTEHAKTREQFGRPIGVNQAIKHKCADMAVYSEAASAQLFYAAAALDKGQPDYAFQASIARVIASRGALFNAETNIQVHGGMGYTSEGDAQLYVKRTRALSYVLGSRTSHLATIVGAEAAA